MPRFILSIYVAVLLLACREQGEPQTAAVGEMPELIIAAKDTVVTADTVAAYTDLVFDKKESIVSAPGTKSVLFNAAGTKLYAMNLEGMSVYEFDQPSKKIIREFRFKPTKGIGWDYTNDKPIPSYQEKPVEACFTHDDRILWVSLHNAGGIVPIRVDSFSYYSAKKDSTTKQINVIYPGTTQKDSFYVPLIKTGKTPKVISRTADSRYLLVSNWHSYSVSVLELNPQQAPFAKLISTIPVPSIPRGIAVDDKNAKSYVAIMGGASITVINNWVWQKEGDLQVASNPRHIVTDTSGHMYVSYNKLAQIACVDLASGKILFSAPTHTKPRTIVLSKNQKFLFVTCYDGNMVDVFKITGDGFQKIYSIDCPGKPVGVDIFEDNEKLEAWVCSYTNGTINVLTFKKSKE